MNEELVVRMILGVIAIVLGWISLSLANENKRLRKALDQATNNDTRDPATGRYVSKAPSTRP